MNNKQTFTFNKFLSLARDTHGFKYCYDESSYSKMGSKLRIKCEHHGWFEQQAHKHIRGQGCPICARRLSASEFVDRSRNVHGDKYDYSLVNFVHTCEKVTIICPEHGVFNKYVSEHMNGAGCPKCFWRVPTFSQFVVEANKANSNKYKYIFTEIEDRKTKVEALCQEHGRFKRTVSEHLKGKSCQKCSVKRAADLKRKSLGIFIDDAKSIHGDKYDYSKVEYTRSSDKITIICKQHGEFKQVANSHLAGSGCPKCCENGFNTSKWSEFYVVSFGEFVGFGVTNDPKTRLKKHKSSIKKNGMDMCVVARLEMDGHRAIDLETKVKRIFRESIVNSGVSGFVTEALPIHMLNDLISVVYGLEV